MPATPDNSLGARTKALGFTNSRRIATAAAHEITPLQKFTEGYRNREDTSLLDPRTLVAGSHDVRINRAGWVESRKGYIMDGVKSSVTSPIRAPFDWKNGIGILHHLRGGFLTSAANDGKLQIRLVNSAGIASWNDLLTGLSSVYFQYAPYWDTTNLKAKLLIVNRGTKMWEWSGAIGSFASGTATTVTLSGSKTLAQLGFDASGSIIVGGTPYSYTALSGNTFTGLTTDLSGTTVGTSIYEQPVQSGDFSSFTFTNTPTPSNNFTIDLIGIIKGSNQVMVASLLSNQVYLSKAGTYKDYSQSAARLQYEGDMFTTVGPVVALVPQDEGMYVSAGLDEWYDTSFTQTTITNALTGATSTFETAQLKQIKTASLQATQSQYATSKIANDIVFLSNEPILSSLGNVPSILRSPQIVDMSFAIQNDMDAYDFTDAWIAYNKKFVYLGVPRMGLFRIFNMTDPKDHFWEAPQNISLSGVSFDGTTIIGHSYQTSESYVLETGYSDRANDANSTGLPISTMALFAFEEAALPAKRKSFNKFFVEGYISSSTALSVGLIYRSPDPGILPSQTVTINGTDPQVLAAASLVSLGKQSLGKNPIGGDIQFPVQFNLPPYFAIIKTFTRKPHLAYQPSFSSYGVSQNWKLLRFGTNAAPTTENEADITV